MSISYLDAYILAGTHRTVTRILVWNSLSGARGTHGGEQNSAASVNEVFDVPLAE